MSQLVALVARPKDPEGALKLLGEAGLAPAEARMRLAPEPPAMLLRAEAAVAEQLAAALTKAGAPSLALDLDRLGRTRRRILAHRFELGPAQATFYSHDGTETELGYGGMRLILRGLRVTKAEQVRTETVRKFSLGNALLTQGLKMTTTEKREIRTQITTPFHAAVIHGIAGGAQGQEAQPPISSPLGSPLGSEDIAVLLDESELVWQSLGPLMKISRVENLNTLMAELRRRAPNALYDDRMLRLGSRPLALAVGDPFDVIAEVLDQAQRRGLI